MSSQLINTLLLITVFSIPLLGANGNFGYEQIKILFFILSTTLIGSIWLINKPKIRWGLINVVALLFVLILLFTSIVGINSKTSFLGSPPYFHGWIIYIYLWLFSVLVSNSKNKFDEWVKLFTISSALVGILVIKDWILITLLNVPIPTYAGRVASTFGQPNFYAGFLLLTLPFSLNLKNKMGILSVLISMIAILISGSRIAILLLSSLLVFWFLLKTNSKKWIAGGVLCYALLLGVGLYFSVRLSTGLVWQEIIEPFRLQSVASANPSDSVEKRFYMWPLAWKIINQRPFLGSGLENINQAFNNYFTDNKHVLFEENLHPSSMLIRFKDLTIDRSHNFPLDLLLFSGILGFASWGLLNYLLIRRAQNKVLFVSLILYLVWVQFQNQSIVHLMYFWLLTGIITQDA